MATRYSTNNRLAGSQQAMTTTFKTLVELTAATATLTRGALMDLSFGADGAPNATDCQIVYDLSRATTIGTGTAATPLPLDNTSGAAGSVGTVNHTAEPTITAASSLYMIPLNQRASLRVFFDQGIRWPATNLNGLAFRALSPTYTGNVGATLFHEE